MICWPSLQFGWTIRHNMWCCETLTDLKFFGSFSHKHQVNRCNRDRFPSLCLKFWCTLPKNASFAPRLQITGNENTRAEKCENLLNTQLWQTSLGLQNFWLRRNTPPQLVGQRTICYPFFQGDVKAEISVRSRHKEAADRPATTWAFRLNTNQTRPLG